MNSKIGKGEWIVLYVGTGIIDLVQLFAAPVAAALSWNGIGEIIAFVSEGADPFIGAFLAGYFQLRGVSLIQHPSRLFSLLGVVVAEEGSDGIAPGWIADVWYIHRTVKQDQAAGNAQQAQEAALQENVRQPAYRDGMRLPKTGAPEPTGPLNIGGIRAPGGGLISMREPPP